MRAMGLGKGGNLSQTAPFSFDFTPLSRPISHGFSTFPGMQGGGGGGAARTVKRPRQQPAQPPIRQLLGAADAQTAHPATSSTAPVHQRLGSATAETTPAGAPAAATDRTQRPDATCEGKNGWTVQGPVKKQQPDGMSHGGGGGATSGRPFRRDTSLMGSGPPSPSHTCIVCVWGGGGGAHASVCHRGGSRAVLKEPHFFCEGPPLRTATNRQPPPATNRHQLAAATRHQPPPTGSRHLPPTATNRQPPPGTNRHQPAAATRHQPPPTGSPPTRTTATTAPTRTNRTARHPAPTADRPTPATNNRALPRQPPPPPDCPRCIPHAPLDAGRRVNHPPPRPPPPLGTCFNFHSGRGGGLPPDPLPPSPSAQVHPKTWVLGTFFSHGKKFSAPAIHCADNAPCVLHLPCYPDYHAPTLVVSVFQLPGPTVAPQRCN